MKYISRGKAGYMVRKRVNGRLYQSFFGDSGCGGKSAAKKAAIAYRDRFLFFLSDQKLPSRRFKNTRNRTGVVGVAWYPPLEEEGEDSREHVIRARVTNENNPKRLTTRSWAVRRYGLWGAYSRAVDWRYRGVNGGRAVPIDEIAASWDVFLDHYKEMLSNHDGRFPALMGALDFLIDESDAPDWAKQAAGQVRSAAKRWGRGNFQRARSQGGGAKLAE